MSITSRSPGGRLRLRQRGLTMIELIAFIMIVGIAVTGILLVMNYHAMHSADPMMRKQALAIAESVLEQVESARFSYCHPSDPQATTATSAATSAVGVGASGCSSASYIEGVGPMTGNGDTAPWNNVANYVDTTHGYALGQAMPYTLVDVNNGAPSASINGTYTTTLTISKGTLPGITPTAPPTGMASSLTDNGANAALGSVLLITVTVSYAGGSITLDGYRTQYAPDLIP